MKKIRALPANEAFVLIWTLAGFILNGSPACAQGVQHLAVTQPGGMPGLPVLTGIEKVTNGINVTWDGPAGYYQLFNKASLNDQTWLAVGGRTNLLRNATVPATPSNAFFRVLGPSPHYLGSQACAGCHGNIYSTETNTLHPGAFTDALFKAEGGQTNSSCLPCHTVGYGLPTGFAITNKNGLMSYGPNLAGVQCENCHGPAANHAANESDPTVRPRVELAATLCGGCHTGPMQPTYEEWKTSGHAAVEPDALQSMSSSTNNISSCGRCHSGSVRLALINGQNPVALTNDLDVAITCVVCHDPHANNLWTNVVTGIIYTNQLRQALSSTNDFFLSTSDSFANKYNPNINICAQCHNHRGASWTSSSRSPHHSPQYNMLLGTVGVLPAGVSGGPAAHAGTGFLSDDAGRLYLVTNQCVTCHMESQGYHYGPPEVAAVTGHKFEVAFDGACAECHGTGAAAQELVVFVSGYISNQIQQVKTKLDTWAATKAPGSLYAAYGSRAWEYTTPGDLSPGGPGPSSAEQALIPDNIKKARFDLYLVLYDGSYGVHNGPYSFTLLESAGNWVEEELNQ